MRVLLAVSTNFTDNPRTCNILKKHRYLQDNTMNIISLLHHLKNLSDNNHGYILYRRY